MANQPSLRDSITILGDDQAAAPPGRRDPVRSRLFCGWDGEGTANRSEDDRTQRYSLFGCNEPGWAPLVREQLSSVEILTYLCQAAKELGNRIHVAFGFGYDIDMILRDVPESTILEMKPHEKEGKPINAVLYGDFQLKWMPRKWFQVRRYDYTGHKQHGDWIRIYETVSYFANGRAILAGIPRPCIAE